MGPIQGQVTAVPILLWYTATPYFRNQSSRIQQQNWNRCDLPLDWPHLWMLYYSCLLYTAGEANDYTYKVIKDEIRYEGDVELKTTADVTAFIRCV